MIETDEEAKKIIEKDIDMNKNKYSNKILNIVFDLFNNYSFVNNQTYPRPSHPLKEKRKDPYFTLIAIILSLRTTLENEIKAVDAFMNRYKTIDDVLESDKEEMINLIRIAGMPNKKADTIFKVSKHIKQNYDGNIYNIVNESIEVTRNDLLKLPGVGDKSADCMLELGFNLPSMVVDINIFRVISRIFNEEWAEVPNFSNKNQVESVKRRLEDNLPENYLTYQIVHTMLLLKGKHICKSKSKCEKCSIKSYCEFYNFSINRM